MRKDRLTRVCAGVMAFVTVFTTGCTGLSGKIARSANEEAEHGHALVADSEHGRIAVHAIDDVVVNDGIWLSGRTVKLSADASLPPLFAEPATFDRSVSSLQEFAERITRLTQMPTKVAPDASTAAQRTLEGFPGGDAHSGGSTIGSSAVVKPPLPPARGGSPSSGGASMPLHIVYSSGTLKGLLDSASAQFGVYWKYANGVISFYFTDTRTFQVSAVPGDSSLKANVVSAANNENGSSATGGSGGMGGSGGGTGGGSGGTGVSSDNTSTTQVNSQLSIFGSLEAAIKAMLSPYGNVVASPATGSISVTDTPDALERVGRFMEEQNRVMSRQVMINVTVLTVTLSDEDTYGINWNAVYQALGTSFQLSNTFATAVTGAPTLSGTVITPNSRASGTKAIIAALSEQGKVHRKTSASVTTLNNQPVPVQVATQQGYLASISTTNTANVGSSTSLTPGTVTTGFNMTLLPHMLDDGTVLLQFYTNLSALDDLKTVSSGTGPNALQIQTPEIDTRNFLQRVAMKSGETLVISGYEGTSDNLTEQGVGKAENYAFGGGFQGKRSREVIVILITPIARTATGA